MLLFLLLCGAAVVASIAIASNNARVDRERQIYLPPPMPVAWELSPAPQRQSSELPPFDYAPRRRSLGMAARNRWVIEIVYYDNSGECSARNVTVLWIGGGTSGLDYGSKGDNRELWGGFCHLRDDERTFRIDRVRAIEIINHPDPRIRDRYRVI